MTFLRNTGITLSLLWGVATGFSPSAINHVTSSTSVSTSLFSSNLGEEVTPTRRGFLETSVLSTVGILTSLSTQTQPALADEEQSSTSLDEDVKTVQTPLYYVVRVREATDQESRLIKSGKFKDVQRANVKLAVKFMVENYRLNDNIIAASAYLTGNKRIQAVEAGQSTVQNLFTILEYFDSSDVQNIKVRRCWDVTCDALFVSSIIPMIAVGDIYLLNLTLTMHPAHFPLRFVILCTNYS
jgi:hypothetical protein